MSKFDREDKKSDSTSMVLTFLAIIAIGLLVMIATGFLSTYKFGHNLSQAVQSYKESVQK